MALKRANGSQLLLLGMIGGFSLGSIISVMKIGKVFLYHPATYTLATVGGPPKVIHGRIYSV